MFDPSFRNTFYVDPTVAVRVRLRPISVRCILHRRVAVRDAGEGSTSMAFAPWEDVTRLVEDTLELDHGQASLVAHRAETGDCARERVIQGMRCG